MENRISGMFRMEEWCDSDGKVFCSEWESDVIQMEKCSALNGKVV